MVRVFKMILDKIQPSQLYISTEKLAEVMKAFNPANPDSLDPIPIKKLGNDVIFVDGHTRALAAFLHGLLEVPVYWEDEKLDWDAYKVCMKWCKDEGIHTIADLKNRIISQENYEVLWLKRCDETQRDLEARRKIRSK